MAKSKNGKGVYFLGLRASMDFQNFMNKAEMCLADAEDMVPEDEKKQIVRAGEQISKIFKDLHLKHMIYR